MPKIVFLRHGESAWNKRGLFTGWVDVDLTVHGRHEAREAGCRLKKAGLKFDVIFESYLRRCRETTQLVLDQLKMNVSVRKDWRLNERHYGALQGLNKKSMVEEYGEEQVFVWRRSYKVRPPKIKSGSRYDQSDNIMYQKKGIPVPRTENLEDVEKRVSEFWREKIIPALKNEQNILISSSGNTLRALIKFLSKMSVQEVIAFNIPTGLPLICELDNQFNYQRHYYLATKNELLTAVNKVKNQIKINRLK